MTQYRLLTAAAVAALTFGLTGPKLAPVEPAPPLSNSDIVIAADDSGQADESAKMGKENGTHSGDEAETSESDTKKIDQPDRQNQTTGD